MKHVYDYKLEDLSKLLAADKIHTSDELDRRLPAERGEDSA